MKNVLIICTANKARSVMAMEIARKIALKYKKPYFFQSAGTAVIGSGVDSNAKKILFENRIETEHVPVHVEKFDPNKFDFVHVMTERQKTALCAYFKEKTDLEKKITVLYIDDPFGKGIEAYRECYGKLTEFYEDYILNDK